jgi:transposase
MVAEVRPNYESEFEAIRVVAQKLGIGSAETLRKWIRRQEIDAGQRPGVTSDEAAEIKRLRRENAELKRANEILRTASAFFAAELDRPQRYS